MKVSVTLEEVISLVRQKVHVDEDDDFCVEFIEQPISTVETWGIIPWEGDVLGDGLPSEDELFKKLEPDVREAVGYTTSHHLDIFLVKDKFISGKISWDIFDRFVKTATGCRFSSDCTRFYNTIIAVEIDGDNVTLATAARYLCCSDSHVKNLLKKGGLHYLPETKQIPALELISLRGGKYIDGHLAKT